MTAKLHIFPPSFCLIEQLIDELKDKDREKLRRTLVIVPTQRLGTVLLVGLLRERAAIIPPTLLTLESLLRSSSAPNGRAIAADATLDLMLRQRLEEEAYTHLRVGHERELRLLYAELFDHGLRESGLEQLNEAIQRDIYKNDQHLGSLYDRALEIQDIFQVLDSRLEAAGLICRSQFLADSAKNLRENWSEFTGPYDEIQLLGFTSMASSWQILLESMVADDRLHFWMSEAPEIYHRSSPLVELLDRIQKKDPEIVRGPSRIAGPRASACFVAGSVREEVEWAYRMLDRLRKQGVPEEKMALLVTDENLYGTAIRSVFAAEGKGINLALPESWGGTLSGRHLHALLEFWNEKESLPALIAWLDHPLTLDWWERLREQRSELPRLDDLRNALLHAGVPSKLRAMHDAAPQTYKEALMLLVDELSPLHPLQPKSLGNWVATLSRYIEDFRYWDSFTAMDRLQSSREIFDDFCRSLHAIGHDHVLLPGRSFWDLVESHLLKGAVRGTGEPLAGIQVISLAEARYFPFQVAIILGCHEGCFPKALPQDELLDNFLKKAMGLPGWEVLEAMEDQTFHLLKARLPHLIMLRSARLGEELLVRSRFTEAMIAKEGIREIALPAPYEVHAGDKQELAEEGRINNWLEPSTSRMSSSRLEKLLHCPYSFLLDSLGVRPERQQEGDGRREGEWLHDVLQAFVTGRTRQRIWMDPWYPDPDFDIYEQAKARFTLLTDMMAPDDLKESALVHHLKEFSWPAYAKHFLQVLKPKASYRELGFGAAHQPPVGVRVRNREREIHGRMDAVDIAPGLTVVTDFKRRTIPSQEKSREGLNPQLAFYALALQQQSPVKPLPGMLLGYWNIYQGSWHAHGVEEDLKRQLSAEGLCGTNTTHLDALIGAVIDIWAWRETRIEDYGRFYADSSDCHLCSFAGICRRDDPRAHDRIAAQDELNRRESMHE